jgi:hypothetical protein
VPTAAAKIDEPPVPSGAVSEKEVPSPGRPAYVPVAAASTGTAVAAAYSEDACSADASEAAAEPVPAPVPASLTAAAEATASLASSSTPYLHLTSAPLLGPRARPAPASSLVEEAASASASAASSSAGSSGAAGGWRWRECGAGPLRINVRLDVINPGTQSQVRDSRDGICRLACIACAPSHRRGCRPCQCRHPGLQRPHH